MWFQSSSWPLTCFLATESYSSSYHSHSVAATSNPLSRRTRPARKDSCREDSLCSLHLTMLSHHFHDSCLPEPPICAAPLNWIAPTTMPAPVVTRASC